MQRVLSHQENLEFWKRTIEGTQGFLEIKDGEPILIMFPNEKSINKFFRRATLNVTFKINYDGNQICFMNDNFQPSFIKCLINPFVIVNECLISKDDFKQYIKKNISNSDTRIKLSNAFDALDRYSDYYLDCKYVDIDAIAFRKLFKKFNKLRNETCKITGGCHFKDSPMPILTNMLMALLTCFTNLSGYIDLIDEEFINYLIHETVDNKVKLSNTFILVSLMNSLDYLGYISDDLVRHNIRLVSDKKIETSPSKNEASIYSPTHRISEIKELVTETPKNTGLDDKKIKETIDNSICVDNNQTSEKDECLTEDNIKIKDDVNKLSKEEMIRIVDIGLITIRRQFLDTL